MKLIILLFEIIFLSYLSYSQEDIEWVTYKANKINNLLDDGNYIWVGGDKFLSKINKTTGIKIVYNETNSGLPPGDVKCIAMDSHGDKWVATLAGLAKFDGTNWTLFNELNSGLPYDVVTCIAIDKNDVKWIGTQDGLARFDDTSWTVYNSYNSGLPYHTILSIAIDLEENIWIGMFDSCVAKFDGINWTSYTESNSGFPGKPIEQNLVYSIFIDKNTGEKWFGTSNEGLVRFDGTNWTVYNKKNSEIPDGAIFSITKDRFDNLWIGTNRGGMAKYDGSTWTKFNESNSGLPHDWVNSIVIDNNDIMWIGTWYGGMAKYDGNIWTIYSVSNSGLLDDQIFSICIDNLGIKWIGTSFGMAKFDGTNWTIFHSPNYSFPWDGIDYITTDNDNNKWIGKRNGLAKFDGNNWEIFDKSNTEMPLIYINSIAIDNNNVKWIGTDQNGLIKFDGTNWELFDTLTSDISNNYIRCLLIDKNNDKWIGTYEGLIKFDGINFTAFNTSNSGLPNNWIRCMALDSNNNMWIGTDSGLVVFDGIKWTVYFRKNFGLPNNVIFAIAVDKNNVKWIGTSYNSVWTSINKDLAKFDGVNWTVYNYYNSGMPHDIVRTITIDDNGDKWIGTDGGGLAFYSEKIFTENITGNFCGGEEFDIDFTAKEQFNNGNVFTVQLSEYTGAFEKQFKPVVIGSLAGRNSGTIHAKIPKEFYMDGNYYRIRVSGSDPYARGVDNGRNLTIHSSPKPQITGSFEVIPGSIEKYNCNNGKNLWRVEKGIIVDSTSLYISIRWHEQGQGKIVLVQENSFSCIDSAIQIVDISIPNFEIQGKKSVCQNDTVIYNTDRISNAEILWTVENNGHIIGENTDDSIVVFWNNPGNSKVSVQQTINGYSKEVTKDVTVNEKPAKPSIELAGDKLISSFTNGNQWFHNDTLISGATNQIFIPKDYTGYYQVQVVNETGCVSELSEKYYFDKNPVAYFRIGDGTTIRAKIGEQIEIPIYILSNDDLTQTGLKSITARLRYNYSLLKPLDNLQNEIKLNERIIQLDFTYKNQELWATLKFKAELGNNITTILILDSISFTGAAISLTSESYTAIFELTGVCMEGGYPRLISNNGEVRMILLSPNPSTESCELEFELIEKGNTKIFICDVYGKIIKDLLNCEIANTGKNKLLIDNTDISTGLYYIVLQTPTIRKAIKMEVVK